MPRNALLRKPILSMGIGSICATLLFVGCEGERSTGLASAPKLHPNKPAAVVATGEYLNVYVHAHQDDWQLFMGDRVTAGLQTIPSAVFIYTTAGDSNDSTAYWLARELAAQASVEAVIPAGASNCATQAINGHPIWRCSNGRTASYNLRLPNCPTSGVGYGGRPCLSDLRDGNFAAISAIDASTTYTSWSDLVTTIRSIVDYESSNQGAPYVQVHSPDYDRSINSADHVDHLATADAVQAAAATRSWNLSYYVDYKNQSLPVNLTQAQHDSKQQSFYAYDSYMGSRGYGYEQYDQIYQDWLWRTNVRAETSVPTPPPAAPTGLTAQTASSSRVDLAWVDNATNETGYRVERAPNNSGVAGTYDIVATLAANTTNYINTGLSQNTTYWFRVSALSTTDSSDYSNQVSGTTFVVPARPTNLTATPISTTRIDLAWTDHATNETSYIVQRAPDNNGAAGTYTQIASLPADAASYSNTGLAANTRYWYRVRAANATDQSSFSVAASATTLQGPPAPTNLAAAAASPNEIDLSWTDNATTESGYTVERAPNSNGAPGTFALIATLPPDAAAFANAGLSPNTTYWYRVRAFAGTDVSAYSSNVSATTPQAPPAPPTNLQAQATSSSAISLSWTDNANNETGFQVESAPDNAGTPGAFSLLASVGANVVAYTNSGLAASTSYWYRVRATNAAGQSTYTNNATAKTFAPVTTRTDVFFHAHQDDWQLFMGDQVSNSLQTATKVVIVYVTAGDGGDTQTYWSTRELAARAAIDAYVTSGTWTCTQQSINGHPLHRCAKGKVVSIDMRLPNGTGQGTDFNGRGTLNMLRDGASSSLAAVDGSSTYASWADVTTTVGRIVEVESNNASAPLVEVHAPETNRTTNLNDHADHLAVGDAVLAASASHQWNLNWYIDYQTSNMPINLTQAVRNRKQLAFYAYDGYMGSRGYGYERYDQLYQDWLWRTYVRHQTP